MFKKKLSDEKKAEILSMSVGIMVETIIELLLMGGFKKESKIWLLSTLRRAYPVCNHSG